MTTETVIGVQKNPDLLQASEFVQIVHKVPQVIPFPKQLTSSPRIRDSTFINIRYVRESSGELRFKHARKSDELTDKVINTFRHEIENMRQAPNYFIVSYKEDEEGIWELYDFWVHPESNFVLRMDDASQKSEVDKMNSIYVVDNILYEDPEVMWLERGEVPHIARITSGLSDNENIAGHFFFVYTGDSFHDRRFTRIGGDTSVYPHFVPHSTATLFAYTKIPGKDSEGRPLFEFDPKRSISAEGHAFDFSKIDQNRDEFETHLLGAFGPIMLTVADQTLSTDVESVWINEGKVPRYSVPPKMYHEKWREMNMRMDNFYVTLSIANGERLVENKGWMDRHPHGYAPVPDGNEVATVYYRRITNDKASATDTFFELDPRYSKLADFVQWSPDNLSVPTKLEREVEDVWSNLMNGEAPDAAPETSPDVPEFDNVELQNASTFRAHEHDEDRNYMFVDWDHDFVSVQAFSPDSLLAMSGWTSYWKRLYRRDHQDPSLWRRVELDAPPFVPSYEFVLDDGRRIPIFTAADRHRMTPSDDMLDTDLGNVRRFLRENGMPDSLYALARDGENIADLLRKWQQEGNFAISIVAHAEGGWLMFSSALEHLRKLQQDGDVPWQIVPHGSYVARDIDKIAVSAEQRWYDAPDGAQRCQQCTGKGGWYEGMTYVACPDCNGTGVTQAA